MSKLLNYAECVWFPTVFFSTLLRLANCMLIGFHRRKSTFSSQIYIKIVYSANGLQAVIHVYLMQIQDTIGVINSNFRATV